MPRLRFSLRTFLVVLITATLVASNFFTAWQLGQLREENSQLRKELGRLEVTDPKKINIIAVPTYEDMLWRWRIYMPEGHSLRLCESAQDVPQNGFPEHFGSSGPLQPGEYLLTAAIRRDRNGQWQITVAGPQSSSSFGIADEHAAWLVDNPGWETAQAGSGAAEVYDPDQPFTLLRVRSFKRVSPNSSTSNPEPTDGVLLWIKKE
ncbi:MAG TPA: hypothetical protein VJ783_16465 [Pirellulales bacterium]|nr:hypothetical protein [Pirellulales bacterium]